MSADRESAQGPSNITNHSTVRSTDCDKTIDSNGLVEIFTQFCQGKPMVNDLLSIFSPNVLNKPTADEESSSTDSTISNNIERNARKRSTLFDSEKKIKRRKSQMSIDSRNNGDSSNDRCTNRRTSVNSEDRANRSQESRWDCTLCERKLTTKGNLLRHYREVHKEMSPGQAHEGDTAENAVTNIPNKGKERMFDQTEKEGKHYDCKLCEAVFKTASARNSHYTGRHKIKDEKLLFLPNGIALVESSLGHHISLKPDWFKAEAAAAKSNDSTKCKLCDIDISKYCDKVLNLHYQNHKANINVVEQLVRLKNTDIKEIADTHKCSICLVVFDDARKLEQHSKRHAGGLKRGKFRNVSVERRMESDMFSKQVDSENNGYLVREQVKSQEGKREETEVTNKVQMSEVIEDKKAEVTKNAEAERAWYASVTPAAVPALMMFFCRTCNLATASYDNAVAHCQDHILKLETQTQLCTICNLKFGTDFETHEQLHLADDDIDRDSFKYVFYDYRNLMGDTWMDMFDMFSKATVKRIESASVYFSTRCVRLKLERDSSEASDRFTLFKCVTCQKYVDPQSVTTHVGQENACANQLSCFPCYECQKPFFTQTARDHHAPTHKLPNADRKYRTVLFNHQNDFKFNKILLQASVQRENENGGSGVKNVHKVPDRVSSSSHIQVEMEANEVSTEHGDADDIDKVADVYKCQCGLCFDRLEFLFNHLQNCSPALTIATKTCQCGLVFDKSNYDFHCKVHRDGFTMFNVKEVIIRIEKTLDVRGMAEMFRNASEYMSASKVVGNDKEKTDDEVNSNNKDATKEQQEEINLQNKQVTVKDDNILRKAPKIMK